MFSPSNNKLCSSRHVRDDVTHLKKKTEKWEWRKGGNAGVHYSLEEFRHTISQDFEQMRACVRERERASAITEQRLLLKFI